MESNKVKLPKEVAEAIKFYEENHGDFWKHHILSDAVESERYIARLPHSTNIKVFVETGSLELLLQALVNGYEVEECREDKVRKVLLDYYESPVSNWVIEAIQQIYEGAGSIE